MLDDIIKFLTTLAIVAILCLVLNEIRAAAWGKRLGDDGVNWDMEKVKDLEAQKEVLLYKLRRG